MMHACVLLGVLGRVLQGQAVHVQHEVVEAGAGLLVLQGGGG